MRRKSYAHIIAPRTDFQGDLFQVTTTLRMGSSKNPHKLWPRPPPPPPLPPAPPPPPSPPGKRLLFEPCERADQCQSGLCELNFQVNVDADWICLEESTEGWQCWWDSNNRDDKPTRTVCITKDQQHQPNGDAWGRAQGGEYGNRDCKVWTQGWPGICDHTSVIKP